MSHDCLVGVWNLEARLRLYRRSSKSVLQKEIGKDALYLSIAIDALLELHK
jgi:hypothetical protein